jgi:DNA polymerase I-like protein with 3'-5' exonuclease and polymerase domains
LPQSTAADIIYRAMLGLMYERVGLTGQQAQKVCPLIGTLPRPCRLLLQVHDSLVFECPNDLVDEVKATLKAVMEQPWKELNGLVIPVSIKVGDNWLGE